MIFPKSSDFLSVRNGVFLAVYFLRVFINNFYHIFNIKFFLHHAFLNRLNLRRRWFITLTDETIEILFYLFFHKRTVSGRNIRGLDFVSRRILQLSSRDCFPFRSLALSGFATHVDYVYFV